MEERRQAAALRKAEEEKSRTVELEKKRKEREELAKSVKAPVKKVSQASLHTSILYAHSMYRL
jgi:hypothetical protein